MIHTGITDRLSDAPVLSMVKKAVWTLVDNCIARKREKRA